MRSLDQAWSAYVKANEHLQTEERGAKTAAERQRWARLRVISDRAYFVLMFACLQERIDQLCRKLVKRKRGLRSWRAKRRWQSVDPDQLWRVSFMERVSWLVDKGRADYATVDDLYQIRCDIAHGTFADVPPLNIPSYHRQIRKVWEALRP